MGSSGIWSSYGVAISEIGICISERGICIDDDEREMGISEIGICISETGISDSTWDSGRAREALATVR